MGISGYKDILDSCEFEVFWLGVLNDLKARGLEDIIITCMNVVKGFPEAINVAYPKAEIHLCVVHQIRNSLKHVASRI